MYAAMRWLTPCFSAMDATSVKDRTIMSFAKRAPRSASRFLPEYAREGLLDVQGGVVGHLVVGPNRLAVPEGSAPCVPRLRQPRFEVGVGVPAGILGGRALRLRDPGQLAIGGSREGFRQLIGALGGLDLRR